MLDLLPNIDYILEKIKFCVKHFLQYISGILCPPPPLGCNRWPRLCRHAIAILLVSLVLNWNLEKSRTLLYIGGLAGVATPWAKDPAAAKSNLARFMHDRVGTLYASYYLARFLHPMTWHTLCMAGVTCLFTTSNISLTCLTCQTSAIHLVTIKLFAF